MEKVASLSENFFDETIPCFYGVSRINSALFRNGEGFFLL